MKKILYTLSLCALTIITLTTPALAQTDANWWGTFCKQDKSLCIFINNVGQNKMGIFHFRYSFTNNTGKEIAEGVVPTNEGEEMGREGATYFLKLNLSQDNNSIIISHYPDQKIENQDGLSKDMFGTYLRKQ